MVTQLHIRAINPSSSRAFLELHGIRLPCLLGRNGRSPMKHEGDGKSPVGRWRLGQLFYRADRVNHVPGGKPLRPTDGWCDEPGHGRYNRPVNLPFAASHEALWRADEAYDILCLTSHNQRPRSRGRGSAIFLHIWREGATGTEGCIALKPADLRKVLARCGTKAYLVI